MLMRKNLIYSLLKNKKMTSDFVSVCCNCVAMQRLHYKFNNLAKSRKNSRKKGMVFKPSFKCLKSKKINFIQAFLKLETLLYQNIYVLFHLILYSQSDFDSKKKVV